MKYYKSRKRNNSRRKKSKRVSRKVKKSRSRGSRKNIFYISVKPVSSADGSDFKLIELEGCKYCQDAKKLIKDKGFTLKIKKTLSPSEENEIKNKVGDYPYFPKIFKYNKSNAKYEFIGGFDKLKELL